MGRISVTHRTPTGRRNYARWLLAAVAALTAAATAVVPGTAALAAPTRTAHLQSSPVTALPRASAAQQRVTPAYWTPQRMAEAKSFDILSDGHAGPATARTADPYAGKPEMLPGGLPADTSVVDSAAFLDRPSAVASSIFEEVPVTLTKTYPYRTNGKIFFTWNGEQGQCSGTSVLSYQGSSDEDEVWTAGHCLVNSEGQADGIHATNIEFVPAYDGSASTFAARYPFGVFPYAAGHNNHRVAGQRRRQRGRGGIRGRQELRRPDARPGRRRRGVRVEPERYAILHGLRLPGGVSVRGHLDV